MRQMPPVRQRKTHDHITRLAETQIDRLVGRRTRIGLNVDVLGTKNLLGAFDAKGLDLVDLLLALVITLTHITFGIFICQDRTGGSENRPAGIVLGRNQANLLMLAPILSADDLVDFRIHFDQCPANSGLRCQCPHCFASL